MNYIYSDFAMSDPLYIPLRTMTRQGIMRGYPSTYGYVIKPSQCSSRVDVLTALSKVVYILGSTDVYKTRQEGSPFVDMNHAPSDVLSAINR